jgi:putative sigma-54 modulation protein
MKIIVSGRHMHVRDDFVDYATSKLEKFDSYFDENVEAHLTFSHRKKTQIFEVTILMRRGVVLRGEDYSEDIRTAIDGAIAKVSRQIIKHKQKLVKKYYGEKSIKFSEVPETDEVEGKSKIVKSKRFGIKPMMAEEAAMQMELIGHDFFVFLNPETDEVNVIYTRKDGNFGLIEPYF